MAPAAATTAAFSANPVNNQSSFHCSIERHLLKLKSAMAIAIYMFAAKLSNG